jgi:hypothetical protein
VLHTAVVRTPADKRCLRADGVDVCRAPHVRHDDKSVLEQRDVDSVGPAAFAVTAAAAPVSRGAVPQRNERRERLGAEQLDLERRREQVRGVGRGVRAPRPLEIDGRRRDGARGAPVEYDVGGLAVAVDDRVPLLAVARRGGVDRGRRREQVRAKGRPGLAGARAPFAGRCREVRRKFGGGRKGLEKGGPPCGDQCPLLAGIRAPRWVPVGPRVPQRAQIARRLGTVLCGREYIYIYIYFVSS